jgi:tetratricopeptide (TPR) repeat protein
MTSPTRDSQLDSLWAELNSLLPHGPSPRAEAVGQRLRARAEQLVAAGDPGAVEHLANAIFCTGNLASMGGRLADAEAAYRAALPYAERSLADQPDYPNRRDLLASLHYNIGNICSAMNRQTDAEAAYRAALEHQEINVRDRPDLPELRNHLAQTRFNLGNVCLALRRGPEAAEWFRAARELWLRLAAEQPDIVGHAHNLARSCFNFGYVAGWQGPTAEALDAHKQAQDVWERLLQEFGENVEQRCDVARCCFNHSMMLSQAGRHEEAVAAIERGLPHFDRLVELAPQDGNFTALHRQAHDFHSHLLANPSDRVAAEQVAHGERLAAPARAAGDWQRLREVGIAQLNQARAFCQGHRPVEMEQIYRAALGLIVEAARSDPSTETAHIEAAVWFDLNIDLRTLGRYDGAEQAVRTALRRWQRLRAANPGDPRFRHWLAGAHNNVGIICADTGRGRAAEAAYRTALALREEAARAAPDDPENQLFLGGALCNLGNLSLDRGQLDAARDFYGQALGTLDAVRGRLPGNELVGQFLQNTNDGLAACQTRRPVAVDRFRSATMSWAMPGPPALVFDVADAGLTAALRSADALRLAGDTAVEQATADLVVRAPACAEAWLLRGLVLANFRTEGGNTGPVPWHDERHEAATAAFYEALVYWPDWYEAKLYKGLALRQAAHAAQAGWRATHAAVASLPEAEREGYLAPRGKRFQWDMSRSRESLEAAARLLPADGRAWYELAELFHGLGYSEEVKPFLERLRAIGGEWEERARVQFKEE